MSEDRDKSQYEYLNLVMVLVRVLIGFDQIQCFTIHTKRTHEELNLNLVFGVQVVCLKLYKNLYKNKYVPRTSTSTIVRSTPDRELCKSYRTMKSFRKLFVECIRTKE